MPRDVLIGVAAMAVGTAEDVLVTLGLGSCVAIALHDGEARIGGMAHILLPSRTLSPKAAENPAKFPHSALPELIAQMARLGGDRRRFTGRLVGGASMFGGLAPPGSIQMGERNLVASRDALSQLGIPLIGEAVGGDFGRSVRFRIAEGVIDIRSVAHGEQRL
jgi:chemotaxis protein CheD